MSRIFGSSTLTMKPYIHWLNRIFLYNILVQVLLRLWKHECKRVIADRFTAPEDVVWFDYTLAKLVEEELGEEERMVVDLGVDSYFVDFLRDAPEATGNDQKQIQIQKNDIYSIY